MSKLFPINIEVQMEAVGSVLLALNEMPGVLNVNMHLKGGETSSVQSNGQDIAPLQRNLQGRTRSSRQVIGETLKVGPMHRSLLGEVLVRNGFAASSLPSLVTKMRANGELRVTAPGTYKLTERGLSLYNPNSVSNIKLAGKRRVGRPGGHVDNATGVRGLVLSLLANAPSGAQSNMILQVLKANNYSPKNLSGVVYKMRQEGLIERDEDHLWRITSKGTYVRGEPQVQNEVGNA